MRPATAMIAQWADQIREFASTNSPNRTRLRVRPNKPLAFQSLEDRRLLVMDPYGGQNNVYPDSTYPAVVKIHTEDFHGTPKIGTGVLIRSQWVLTAAHIINGLFTETMTIGGKPYHAIENWAAAGWFGPGHQEHDIGILKLNQPVDNVEPIPMYSSAVSAGQILTLVGYGQTGSGTTGTLEGTGGQKRLGNVRIDEVHARTMTNRFDQGESFGTFGDSGAPYFIRVPVNVGGSTQQRLYVAGIHSAGVPPGYYGQTSTIIRVDRFAAELYEDIRISNGQGLSGRPVAGRFVTTDGVSQEEGGLDTTAPGLAGGPAFGLIGVDATGEEGAVVTFPAFIALDDYDLDPEITYSHASGSSFPVGQTEVVVTARDESGNVSTRSFFVQVASPLPLHGFDPPITLAAGGQVSALVQGDLNGDELADLAAVYQTSNGRKLRTFLGRGDGTFDDGIVIGDEDQHYASSMALDDIDGDGHADLVVASHSFPYALEIWRGAGDGTFAQTTEIGLTDFPVLVRSADVNGDGFMDLLALLENGLSNDLHVYLGSALGISNIATAQVTSLANPIRALEVTDLDADGRSDLALAYGVLEAVPENEGWFTEVSGGIALLHSLGNGFFAAPQEYARDSAPYHLTAVDVNLDEKPDLTVFSRDGIALYLGNGDATLDSGRELLTAQLIDASVAAVADFDGDGNPDILARDAVARLNLVLSGAGDGTFEVTSFPFESPASDWASFGSHTPVAIADFDRNGSPDIAAQSGFESIAVSLNQADAPLLASGVTLSLVQGLARSIEVATFSDPPGGATTEDYLATIEWENGLVAPGQIEAVEGGGFRVLGSHHFLQVGSFEIGVEIHKKSGGSVTVTSHVVVGNDPPSLLPANLILSASTLQNGESLVLTGAFSDAGLLDQHYVLITWGDNSYFGYETGDPQPNTTVVEVPAGERTFSASHIYLGVPRGNSQQFTIEVQVVDEHLGESNASTNVVIENFNRAPILDASGTPALNPVVEDFGVFSAGTYVADLLNQGASGNLVADPDDGGLKGIAVVAADTKHGEWEYSLNNGPWLPLGDVDEDHARLLPDLARVRFLPAADYFGTLEQAISFFAWDQTSGEPGAMASTSSRGGQTSLSVDVESASITVLPVNDEPHFVVSQQRILARPGVPVVVRGWAQQISPGAANESDQDLQFRIIASHDSLFDVLPTVDASTGDLRFQLARSARGMAGLSLHLTDDGAPEGLDARGSAHSAALLIVDRPTDRLVVAGAGAGGGPHVRALDAESLEERFSFYAFDPGFSGGVRVATGDVNGDGTPDIVTAAGPGGGPHVRVFDGVTGNQLPGLIGSFYAYHPHFAGGVFVAAGDINGDGRDDVITAAGAGGGPHVRVFSGLDGTELRGFYAYHPLFSGGVSVATGDVNNDGRIDIISGAGAGGGPHVRVFSGMDHAELQSFYAYAPLFSGGVFVAGGDVNGDGHADIVTGAGSGGGPHVKALSGTNLAELASAYAFDPSFGGGVRVGASDVDADGLSEIVVAPGWGSEPNIRIIDAANREQRAVFAYARQFLGGVYITGVAAAHSVRSLHAPAVYQNTSDAITSEHVEFALGTVVERVLNAGLDPLTLDRLEELRIHVMDLPGSRLGLFSGNIWFIDDTAAGRGWFVDPTPQADEEYVLLPSGIGVANAGPAAQFDLTTAVAHAFGHLLGLPTLAEASRMDATMAHTLAPGVRKPFAAELVDAVMALDLD